jgi:hypothetical protein
MKPHIKKFYLKMKVNITDTFTKSLKRLMMHESWWYKTYSFIRWDVWHFFSNVWKFRKELYEHRWWDYHFTLQMLYRSIAIMEKGMHAGLEVRESREKKIQKMQRLLVLLDNKINDTYIELAEKELGYEMISKGFEFEEVEETESTGKKLYRLADNETEEERELNRKIFDRARELEKEQWDEIWEILKGQDNTEYIDMIQQKDTNGKQKDWNDWFDGSGIRGWWD